MISRIDEMNHNESMRRAEQREEKMMAKSDQLSIVPSQALLDVNAPTISKAEYSTVVNSLLARIFEEGNGLRELVKIAQLLDVLGQVEKTLREEVVKHVGERAEDVLGAQVKMKSLPKKYDYNDDYQIMDLEARIAALQSEKRGRQAYLESLSGTKTEVDQITGEVKEILPAKLISAGATIAITYRKD